MNKLKLSLALALISLPLLAAPPASQPQLPTVVWDGVTPRTGVTSLGAQTIAQAPSLQSGPRYDCLFQNTSSNILYIDFGATATIRSLSVSPGGTARCSSANGVNQNYVSLYDPIGGDSYYILVTILQQY